MSGEDDVLGRRWAPRSRRVDAHEVPDSWRDDDDFDGLSDGSLEESFQGRTAGRRLVRGRGGVLPPIPTSRTVSAATLADGRRYSAEPQNSMEEQPTAMINGRARLRSRTSDGEHVTITGGHAGDSEDDGGRIAVARWIASHTPEQREEGESSEGYEEDAGWGGPVSISASSSWPRELWALGVNGEDGEVLRGSGRYLGRTNGRASATRRVVPLATDRPQESASTSSDEGGEDDNMTFPRGSVARPPGGRSVIRYGVGTTGADGSGLDWLHDSDSEISDGEVEDEIFSRRDNDGHRRRPPQLLASRTTAANPNMAGPRSGRAAKKAVGIPLNLMVAGQSHTGKSSFILTLIDSLQGRRILIDASAAATSSSPNTPESSAAASPNGSSANLTSPVAPNSTVAPNTPVLLTAIFPGDDISAPAPIKARIDFEDEYGGERLSLRLIDTPGLPIPVNIHKEPYLEADLANMAKKWSDSIVAYLESQFEATLREESKVRRNPKSPDYQVHACIYLLDPSICLASRGLTELDRIALRKLCTRVNVIPCLGKSDLLTTRQLKSVRGWIMEDIRKSDIGVYAFPEDTDVDNEDGADLARLNAELRSLMPFAIVNDEELDPSANNISPVPASSAILSASTALLRRAGGPLGRNYPWGTVEVENPAHCDFASLRTALFGTHIDELKLFTRETYYEQWRTEKLLEVRASTAIRAAPPSSDTVKRRMAEQKREE
ncbi:hypothetical protein HK101_007717 [Irineochytrium annulatum]|nr:hypothetical protein HK101_007717 [Irineochytrium annulatum]